MKKENDPRPQWFVKAMEQGIYSNITTIPQWLFALDWRLKMKCQIEDKRKNIDRYESLPEEMSLLFNGILRAEEHKVPITTAVSGLRLPIFKYGEHDDFMRNYPEDSFRLKSFGVDFSYDKETLMIAFDEFIECTLKKINKDYLKESKFLTKKDKGLLSYTNSDCFNWANRKVLQCIDFDLFIACSGGLEVHSYKQEKIASILKLTKDEYISAKRAGEALLNPLGVARLRASDQKLIKK